MNWEKYLQDIRKTEIEIIRSYFGDRVFKSGLEIGAGDGYQTSLLSERCDSFISSELNFKRIKDKYKKPNIEYIQCDADEIGSRFESEQFDFVFSSNVLEHLSKPENFLRENARILSFDGYAVHVVPNRYMKFFYILLFYPHLCTLIFDRVVGVFKGKEVFRGKDISVENNINSVSKNKSGRFWKIFVPHPHGNYKGHLEEWKKWGKREWIKKFKDVGFVIEKEFRGPVFSGYGFGCNIFRSILEKMGFSSESIYILRRVNYKIPYKKSGELRIAIIPSMNGGGYETNTILDGLTSLQRDNSLIVVGIPEQYPVIFSGNILRLDKDVFFDFAQSADIILGMYFDGGMTDYNLIKKIGNYSKLILVDGSETKGDGRVDVLVQRKILNFSYEKFGAIEKDLLKKCAIYFRREKPYINGIIPLPYGIETRYIAYNPSIKKDIDFVCIFGQEEYPQMRKYCREMLEEFCMKNKFSCVTSKTKGFNFDSNKTAGRDEFYKLLARAKVGISVSGGGYDTARFWETLGNNCMLLTERIDILHPDDTSLNYNRIWQFNNLFDFQYQLEKMGKYLREEYKQESLEGEYRDIMEKHSSKARVEKILSEAKKVYLLK